LSEIAVDGQSKNPPSRESSGPTTSIRTTTGKRPLQAPGHTQVDFEERINFRD